MLYERDYYLGLTETEEQQYEEITGRKFWEKRVSGFGRVNNFMAYPKAARMCKSLFPNNYLDVAELRDVERLEYANEEFLSLLDNTECTEMTEKQIADKCLNLWDIMFERQLGSVREISRQLMER